MDILIYADLDILRGFTKGILRPLYCSLFTVIFIRCLMIKGVVILNKKNDELVKEFYEVLLKEDKGEDSTAVFGGDTPAEQFLEKLSNDEFFYIEHLEIGS